jgi:hypothetical protein
LNLYIENQKQQKWDAGGKNIRFPKEESKRQKNGIQGNKIKTEKRKRVLKGKGQGLFLATRGFYKPKFLC